MRYWLGLTLALWPSMALAQPSAPPMRPPPPPAPDAADATQPVADAGANEPVAPASDQPEAAPVEEPVEVRVIGEKADALQKVPGSGHLVTSKEIRQAQPNTVGEMLKRVPGLQVRQEEGGGLRLDISVRGLDGTRGRRVLVLEDGIPIAINPYTEPDLYYGPPIERVRGIEVVKGSGSILFGPQTIGGVINFLTLLPPSRREVTLEAQGGLPAAFKVLGRYGDSFNDARYLVQVFHKRGVGFRDEGYDATDVLAKGAFSTSEHGEATIKVGIHDESARSTDVGLTQAMYEEDPRRPTLAPYDDLNVRRYDAALIHQHWFSTTTTLTTLVYGYLTDRIWRRQDYNRTPAVGVQYERIVGDPQIPEGAIYFRNETIVRDRNYEVFGIEPKVEHQFETDHIDHTLSFGARFLAERAHRQQRKGENVFSNAGALEGDETNRAFAFAGYLQDRIAFRDYLLVTPGFRLEHVRALSAINRRDNVDVDLERRSEVTGAIPGIGLVIGEPDLHGFGGLHVGFSPPRVTTSLDDCGRDEKLGAERAIHYEVGGRLARKRWLRVEATGFLSNFENQVISVTPTGATTPCLTNAGRTRHLGFEGAYVIGLGDKLDLGIGLDLTQRYTLSSATFAQGGNEGNFLPYAPLHTINASLDIEHPTGLGGQVSWTFVGSQFSDEVNTVQVDATGREGEVPAYQIIDLGIRFRHQRSGLTFSLTAKNLLDQVYIASRRPDGIFPAGFRQITAGVRWDYAAEPEP